MNKIYLYYGIKGSNAKELVEEKQKENVGTILNFSRYAIRKMLYGVVDNNLLDYTSRKNYKELESHVESYRELLIDNAIDDGFDIVSLEEDFTMEELLYHFNLGSELIITIVNPPLHECIDRLKNHDKKQLTVKLKKQNLKLHNFINELSTFYDFSEGKTFPIEKIITEGITTIEIQGEWGK